MSSKRIVAGLSIVTLATIAIITSEKNCRAQGQNVPNLSGTWELVQLDGTKKNKQTEARFPRLILVISQEGSQIRVTQKMTRRGAETVQEYSYYTDGRGEANTGRIETWAPDVRGFESVSGWRKNSLVTKYDNKVRLGTGFTSSSSGYSTINTAARRSDEWRLGRDTKTLILTSSTVRMHSASITGGAPAPETGAAEDKQASYAEFGKNKLVFRRV